jgi:predicted HAD superfamily Cof-like phosphohydrolase
MFLKIRNLTNRYPDMKFNTTCSYLHEFNNAYGIAELPSPGILSVDRMKLRIALIAEELLELCDASGFRVVIKNGLSIQQGADSAGHHVKIIYTLEDEESIGKDKHLPNIGEIADALGDLDYVIAGTATEMGIPHDAIVAEIHRSNMSKLGSDGKPILRDDGKVLKGPNYTPPNLWPILMGAGKVGMVVTENGLYTSDGTGNVVDWTKPINFKMENGITTDIKNVPELTISPTVFTSVEDVVHEECCVCALCNPGT